MKLLNKSYLRAKDIKLIIFDVDGVLTDGGLYFSDEGMEFKRFHSLDGHGIKMIKHYGIEPAVITARESGNVKHRMQNLGIEHYYQGQTNKVSAYKDLLEKLNLTNNQVAYMGDDVVDLPVMKQVGLPIAPNNAHELVKENACVVTDNIGGNGAVREVCDFLLKAQNKYDEAMGQYLQSP